MHMNKCTTGKQIKNQTKATSLAVFISLKQVYLARSNCPPICQNEGTILPLRIVQLEDFGQFLGG